MRVYARIKPPEGFEGVWVNFYLVNGKLNSGGAYSCRKYADAVAKPYRAACAWVIVPKLAKVEKDYLNSVKVYLNAHK